jgi:hypothetical protein
MQSSLTLRCVASIFTQMIGKKLFVVSLVGAVLLLQYADCIAAFSHDQRAMECCGSSPCTPANQSHECCKTMSSSEIPKMLMEARVSLDVPIITDVELAPRLETAIFTPLIPLSFEPQEHSPPDVYTLNGSLLI